MRVRAQARRVPPRPRLPGGPAPGLAHSRREELALQAAKGLAGQVLEHQDACGSSSRGEWVGRGSVGHEWARFHWTRVGGEEAPWQGREMHHASGGNLLHQLFANG